MTALTRLLHLTLYDQYRTCFEHSSCVCGIQGVLRGIKLSFPFPLDITASKKRKEREGKLNIYCSSPKNPWCVSRARTVGGSLNLKLSRSSYWGVPQFYPNAIIPLHTVLHSKLRVLRYVELHLRFLVKTLKLPAYTNIKMYTNGRLNHVARNLAFEVPTSKLRCEIYRRASSNLNFSLCLNIPK